MLDQAQAQARAERMLREARGHKRASQHHREKARELRRQLDQFIAACLERGMHIHVDPHSPGGQSDNPNRSRTQARDSA